MSAATGRRKLPTVSRLYKYLCERSAVLDNPFEGVERPKEDANQGKTPAPGDA